MKINKLIKSAKKIFNKIKKYDKILKNPDDNLLFGNIVTSLLENRPITFIQFTCSTINPKFLYSNRPQLYVSLNPKGNNLEGDIGKYCEFIKSLRDIKVSTRNIIIIGNTDPYYIYSEQGKMSPNIPPAELLRRFNNRWRIYKNNFENWLKERCPEGEFEVISWYDLEKKSEINQAISFERRFNNLLATGNSYFSSRDLRMELKKLQGSFGEGKYFYNLKKPASTILKRWVKRKFIEYSLQGLWIKQIFPNAILIQNEKPTLLRYRMYQPLIEELYNSRLPNLFIYGIFSGGYQ
jgi:hypothetical protein